MTRSRNSRRGVFQFGFAWWRREYNRQKRALFRSVLSKQKTFDFRGIEDLPHRHEYSDIWMTC